MLTIYKSTILVYSNPISLLCIVNEEVKKPKPIAFCLRSDEDMNGKLDDIAVKLGYVSKRSNTPIKSKAFNHIIEEAHEKYCNATVKCAKVRIKTGLATDEHE